HIHSQGDDNVIIANPHMISFPVHYNDDPYDMFNEYILDIPATPHPVTTAEPGNEMVITASVNSQ
ncbi:hypothetical protein MKW98_021370, partial [Papaver atlanticum]